MVQEPNGTAALTSRGEAVVGPVSDALFHETGHALVELLSVPVPGREEDAADQFAAFSVLHLLPPQVRQEIDFLARVAREEQPDMAAYADEHLPRASMCWNDHPEDRGEARWHHP